MSTNHPWAEALKASSIAEEYNYIRSQKCEKCSGKFEKVMQALLFNEEETPFDLLTCECVLCGFEKKFYFDVSSFFGKNL